ncbi:MAG: hypothetical protein ACREUY_06155 [Burkholderiales bacterium]
MGQTNFDVVQANQFIGGVLPAQSPFGRVFFVDNTNGSDGNTGRSPRKALQTIAAAITAASSGLAGLGDTIVIAPGTYTITAALVPTAHTIFRAAVFNARRPSVIITGNIADLLQVDVDGCQFHGLEIKASGATADNLVDVADGANVDGLAFNGCVFNGADQTSVIALNASDATFILTRLSVVNSLFRDLTGTCINIGAKGFAYSYIACNQFAIDVNSGVGIALADTTAFATGKGYVIEHNVFTGFDATADEVGITIAGTEDTTGAGIIRNNYFAYLAPAAVTIDKLSKSEINNYYGDAATGGTLVDPGT